MGVNLPTEPVCQGHTSPAEIVRMRIDDRPDLSFVHGPRGGGKSFCSAYATHMDSIRYQNHGTKILGGSLAQSGQIYSALRTFDRFNEHEASLFSSFTKTQATYGCTNSEVSILAASRTSVRGPHVPTLCLDEVDEIDDDIRQDALGMCMEMNGATASVAMTSTWHRVGGPAGELIESGRAGAFPVYTFCIFDVLQRCSAERSGRATGDSDLYEKCPECPIRKWCHSEVIDGLPKAKRSSGHSSISTLIQKTKGVGPRVFESDYLCLGPKSAGQWFTGFDEALNVSLDAEYDPNLSVHRSVDSGVHSGAVFVQLVDVRGRPRFHVFADYYAYDPPGKAFQVGLDLLALGVERCGAMASEAARFSTDSAGGAANPVGETVLAQYELAGITGRHGIEQWPKFPGSLLNSLALLDAFVCSADGFRGVLIHPRCRHLIDAFKTYKRAKRQGQWIETPEELQHPSSELIDALRGAIAIEFPDSLKPPVNYTQVPSSSIF